MRLPLGDRYRSAVQHPSIAFSGDAALANAVPEKNKKGLPVTYAGNFTVTFRLRNGSEEWAIRCYTREIRRVAERYSAITRFLETRPDRSFTTARLMPKGILVEGDRYDIIQMEWITGSLLNDYVGDLITSGSNTKLDELADAVLDLGFRLENLGVAHGDIQHGNVIVDARGELRLIDYDDLFLPDLSHLGFSNGIGHENYQHPKRDSELYDATLDRFPLISIYVTLRALSADAALWHEFIGGEDSLLFRKSDYSDPNGSALFKRLAGIPAMKQLADQFSFVCMANYDAVPSLRQFIDGEFKYSRYTARVKASVPDATPVAVRGQPAPAYSPLPPQEPRNIMAILGSISVALIVILTIAGVISHRTSSSIRPSRSVAASSQPAPIPSRRFQPIAVPTRHPVVPKVALQNSAAPQVTPTPYQQPKTRHKNVPQQIAKRAVTVPEKVADASKPAASNVCEKADVPPGVTTLATPQISDEKRAASAGESVVVSVNVAADGAVTGAAVKDSAGDVALDFAALSVARRSSYVPALKSCAPAAGTVNVKVTY